ncbi:MAG: Gldg family protein [Alphaproteobacteria bacterium]|nr:Gldg family protein [Alphaproteobacteria bacterium]
MNWTRSTIAGAAVALSIVLFFAVNIASSVWFSSARLDLTRSSLYTVSAGTKQTLQSIPEPITFRFFFSERASVKYSGVRAYGARVRDLLREYASISGGKLKLEIIDPEALSEQEDLAVAQGVTGAPTPSGEKIYFGLVGTNMVSGHEVIPFFLEDREEYLEYDLTNLIYKLIREKKPKIGVVSNLPFDTGVGGMMAAMQGQSRPFMIYEQIKESNDVEFLEQDFDRVPADIDVLMVAQPKALNAKTQYAIDQFIMRGGRALVFLDPWSEISQAGADPSGAPLAGSTPTSANSIDTLMKSWGVSIDPAHIIGVRDRAQRVSFGGDVVNYVAWVGLTVYDMDRKDLVTGELTDINLGTIGAITALKGATTKLAPLLQTSDDTMEIDVNRVKSDPNPDDLLRDFAKSGEKYTIAARIQGPMKSAFPGGPPVESIIPASGQTPKPPLPPFLKETKGDANIILVADTDIFTDHFWVQAQELQGQRVAVPVADNAVFVLNAIENLSGSSALISLRSRGTSNRPFTVVNDIRRRAEQKFLRQEQELQNKMTATQTRLAELEGRRGAAAKPGAGKPQELLTPEQEAEIEKFRAQLVETRGALRDVQRKLRSDIDRLGTWLAAINVLLVPLMIAGTGIVLAFLRRRKPGVPRTGATS